MHPHFTREKVNIDQISGGRGERFSKEQKEQEQESSKGLSVLKNQLQPITTVHVPPPPTTITSSTATTASLLLRLFIIRCHALPLIAGKGSIGLLFYPVIA